MLELLYDLRNALESLNLRRIGSPDQLRRSPQPRQIHQVWGAGVKETSAAIGAWGEAASKVIGDKWTAAVGARSLFVKIVNNGNGSKDNEWAWDVHFV